MEGGEEERRWERERKKKDRYREEREGMGGNVLQTKGRDSKRELSPLQHTPTMSPLTVWLLLSSTCITLSLQHLMTSLGSQCRISEYQCRNGRCVSLDRFCNEFDDCGDKSDEPRYCSRE
ncbi:hypothetical protein WDU94_003191 [Cyamophila willieti]